MLNAATRDLANAHKNGSTIGENGAFLSRHPLPMQRDIIIVCGMYCGWTNTHIGSMARTSARNVTIIKRKFERAPGLLFNARCTKILEREDKRLDEYNGVE